MCNTSSVATLGSQPPDAEQPQGTRDLRGSRSAQSGPATPARRCGAQERGRRRRRRRRRDARACKVALTPAIGAAAPGPVAPPIDFVRPEALTSLTEEYASGNHPDLHAAKVAHLAQTYQSIQRVRGDGNCFYRAFLVVMDGAPPPHGPRRPERGMPAPCHENEHRAARGMPGGTGGGEGADVTMAVGARVPGELGPKLMSLGADFVKRANALHMTRPEWCCGQRRQPPRLVDGVCVEQ